jgi:hypothetical protein
MECAPGDEVQAKLRSLRPGRQDRYAVVVGTPRHKGKIESGIGYVKGNALKGLQALTGPTRRGAAKLYQTATGPDALPALPSPGGTARGVFPFSRRHPISKLGLGPRLQGTRTFHSCPHRLQRYFVSVTTGSLSFGAIFFRPLNW